MVKNVTVANLSTFKTLDSPNLSLQLPILLPSLKIYQELKSNLNPREQNGEELSVMPVIQHSDEMLLELTKIN